STGRPAWPTEPGAAPARVHSSALPRGLPGPRMLRACAVAVRSTAMSEVPGYAWRPCHRDVIKTSFHVAPGHQCHMILPEPRMNIRVVLAAVAASMSLVACQPAAEGTAAGSGNGAEAAADGAGERVGTGISGAGASFIYPLISTWSADYPAATGHKVNYQSIGSGGGIAQIKAGTVDFGSSDKPLSSDELAEAGLGQFPSAIGGVVPVVNLDGIEPGQLRLTPALLADIFLGK